MHEFIYYHLFNNFNLWTIETWLKNHENAAHEHGLYKFKDFIKAVKRLTIYQYVMISVQQKTTNDVPGEKIWLKLLSVL